MLIFKMKKFIKKILLFALFFILFSIFINAAFLLVIALTDWDFTKRLESLKFDNPDYDLLVLGNSLAQYGVDTELLTTKGVKSFNLAMVGSAVKSNYIQLNEYLTKYTRKPRYTLLVLNSHLDTFFQEGIHPVIEFTMKDHKYGINDIPISKFRWAGQELFKKAFNKKYRNTYLSFGQKKTTRNAPDYSEFQNENLNLQKFESAIWIGKIAELCRSYGIELIIIEIPGVKETQNTSNIGPYNLNFINGYSALLFNFNYHEFCKFIDNEKDWAGLSHFNRYGAEKFTNELFNIVFDNKYYLKEFN